MLLTIPSKAFYVPTELVGLGQENEQKKIINVYLVALIVYSKYYIKKINPMKEMGFLESKMEIEARNLNFA